MIKRLISTCIVLGIAIVLAVSAFLYGVTVEQNISDEDASFAFSEDLSVRISDPQTLIRNTRVSLEAHDWRITLRFNSQSEHMDDIEELARELMNASLANTEVPTQGDYIRYQYGGYEINYNYTDLEDGRYQHTIEIIPDYYTDLDQEQEVGAAVEEILDAMDFTKSTTDYEKVRAIYEYIRETVEYDIIHENQKGYPLKSTAYGALIRKYAVCQGYCVAMYRLLKESGVDCRIVTGYAKYEEDDEPEYHSWNLVEIGDVYYNLDVTWDDLLETHKYFLKSDASFADHNRDAEFTTEEFYARYPMAQEDYAYKDEQNTTD